MRPTYESIKVVRDAVFARRASWPSALRSSLPGADRFPPTALPRGLSDGAIPESVEASPGPDFISDFLDFFVLLSLGPFASFLALLKARRRLIPIIIRSSHPVNKPVQA